MELPDEWLDEPDWPHELLLPDWPWCNCEGCVVELPDIEEPAGCAELFHCPDWPDWLDCPDRPDWLCDELELPVPMLELSLLRPELLEPDVLSRFQELDWLPELCRDGCVVELLPEFKGCIDVEPEDWLPLPESDEPAGCAFRSWFRFWLSEPLELELLFDGLEYTFTSVDWLSWFDELLLEPLIEPLRLEPPKLSLVVFPG